MPRQVLAPQPRSLVWRRRLLALGAFGVVVGAIVVVTASTLGGRSGLPARSLSSLRVHPLIVTGIGQLAGAVEQAVAVPSGPLGAMLVLGGIDEHGTTVDSIQRVSGVSASVVGHLSAALSGAGAAALGGTVYVLGGVGAQVNAAILSVPASGNGPLERVGGLPRAVAYAPVAVVGETAFMIGGFDGTRQLDGIVAWTPGGRAHRTAHLPVALEWAAAAAVGANVIIVGGTSGGTPTRSILRFDPGKHTVTRIGTLPVPLSHATAAPLGGLVFVVGGRTGGPGSETRSVYAIDPATGHSRFAGSLPTALADVAAAPVDDSITLAGGIDRTGRVQSAVLGLSFAPST